MTGRPSPLEGHVRRPAGMCFGPGHVVVYGNVAFRSAYGSAALGLPAREGLLDLPSEAFELFDRVLRDGRSLATWVERRGTGPEPWRLTVVPRRVLGREAAYGVAFHLRAQSDVPVVADRPDDPRDTVRRGPVAQR